MHVQWLARVQQVTSGQAAAHRSPSGCALTPPPSPTRLALPQELATVQQLKGKLLPLAKPAAALEKVAVTAEMKVRFPAVGLVACCVQRWVCRWELLHWTRLLLCWTIARCGAQAAAATC